MRALRLILLLQLSWTLTGCSFVFVRSPPDVLPREYVEPAAIDCTTGAAAPAVDLIVTGLQVARTAYAVSLEESDYVGAPISRSADIGFGVGFSALFLVSSIYGFSSISSCQTFKNRAAETPPPSASPWTSGAPQQSYPPAPQAAPPPLPPPPPKPLTSAGRECEFDAQCGNVMVCRAGRCVAPNK